MPPLTILTDAEVKSILHDLHKYEIEELQQALSESLNDRSITQPVRTVIESKESIGSSTTLFMPSTSSEGLGMKGRVSFSKLSLKIADRNRVSLHSFYH